MCRRSSRIQLTNLRTIRTRFLDWIRETRISALVPVRDSNSYFFFFFFLSPLQSVNLIRVVWTSSLDPGAFSRDGREGCWCWELDNGQVSARSSRTWGGKSGRLGGGGEGLPMLDDGSGCVGVESSEIGRVSAAWFWFDFIPSRDDSALAAWERALGFDLFRHSLL